MIILITTLIGLIILIIIIALLYRRFSRPHPTHLVPLINCKSTLPPLENNPPGYHGCAFERAPPLQTVGKKYRAHPYVKYADVPPGIQINAPLDYFQSIFDKRCEEVRVKKEECEIQCYMCQIILREKPVMKYFDLYHSALVFYNACDVPDILNPDETKILTTLELWAGKGNLAGSLLPVLKPDNTIDTSKLASIAIVFQDPVGFGCNREIFWKGYWQKWWYLGKTKQSNIIQLYRRAREWWKKNDRYSLPSLVSRACKDAKDYSDTFKLYYPPNNCDTFVQSMVAELHKMDSNNFPSSLWNKLYWNDIQIVIDNDKTEMIDMDKPVTGETLKELKTYMSHLSQIFGKSQQTLAQVDVDDPRHAIGARIINGMLKHGAPIFLKILLRHTADAGLKKMFVYSYHQGKFQLMKITLKPPYIQSLFGSCPGMIYS